MTLTRRTFLTATLSAASTAVAAVPARQPRDVSAGCEYRWRHENDGESFYSVIECRHGYMTRRAVVMDFNHPKLRGLTISEIEGMVSAGIPVQWVDCITVTMRDGKRWDGVSFVAFPPWELWPYQAYWQDIECPRCEVSHDKHGLFARVN